MVEVCIHLKVLGDWLPLVFDFFFIRSIIQLYNGSQFLPDSSQIHRRKYIKYMAKCHQNALKYFPAFAHLSNFSFDYSVTGCLAGRTSCMAKPWRVMSYAVWWDNAFLFTFAHCNLNIVVTGKITLWCILEFNKHFQI